MSEHADLDALHTSIKKLRLSYEKYFAGVDRVEPITERNSVKATLRRLRGEYSVNTARKFRLQQLQATLVTHESYWNRICRQIETGTYKRHIAKAERLVAQREAEEAERKLDQETPTSAPEADAPNNPAAAPDKPVKKAVAKKAPKKTAAHPDSVKRLHAAYVKAQKGAGADKTLSITALARTVEKQTAALKERYKCKDVEFKVVLKGNKPVLKAIPK